MINAASTLTGGDALDRYLSEMAAEGANQAARYVVRQGALLLLNRMQANVPAQYKDAKRGLGMTMAKGGEPRAKVGVGVGKASRATGSRNRTRPGVGIGPENLHWFIQGTGERETGSVQRKNKSGPYRKSTGNAVHSTGRMPPHPELVGLVKDTASSSQGEVASVMRDAAIAVLTELAK